MWHEWRKPNEWWPQGTAQQYCYNCGMWYWGNHECTYIKPTITIGGWQWPPLENKMDKKKAILKIAESIAILTLAIEDKMKFDDIWSDVDELLKDAMEELLSD